MRGGAPRQGAGGQALVLSCLTHGLFLNPLMDGFSPTFQDCLGKLNAARYMEHTLETEKHSTHFLDITVKENLVPTQTYGFFQKERMLYICRELTWLTSLSPHLIRASLSIWQAGIVPVGQMRRMRPKRLRIWGHTFSWGQNGVKQAWPPCAALPCCAQRATAIMVRDAAGQRVQDAESDVPGSCSCSSPPPCEIWTPFHFSEHQRKGTIIKFPQWTLIHSLGMICRFSSEESHPQSPSNVRAFQEALSPSLNGEMGHDSV